MRKHSSWLVVGLALVIGIFATIYFWQPSKPLDQQILTADYLEFIGETFPTDGGSSVFLFHLPHRESMALKILHRNSKFERGNPDFQEIWLDRYGGFGPEMLVVQPGSDLENKLVRLLRAAAIKTNAVPDFGGTPRLERLVWAIERIQDRKSKW